MLKAGFFMTFKTNLVKGLLEEKASERLLRFALLVENQAKRNATGRPGPRVDTGRLRSSITHTKPKREAKGLVCKVGSDVEYAPHVELGHRQTPGRFVPAIGKRLVKSTVPPYPYLFPALEQCKNKFGQYFREIIK